MLVSANEAAAVLDTFAAQSRAATVSPEFLLVDAKRIDEAESMNWLYGEGERKFLVFFHRKKIPGTNYYDIESPYPYGGPICNTEEQDFIERANTAFGEWCRDHSIVVEFVRFHPMLRNWRFFRGQVTEDRLTVWVDLESNDLFSEYETRVRTAIRKAEKLGLAVDWARGRESALQFRRLYCDAMRAVGADEFYLFPPEYFEELIAWEKAELALCRYNDHVIGGAIFLCDGGLLEYHLSGCDLEGRKYGANTLILHQAAIRGKAAGLSRFYLGGGTDRQPQNPLLFFKSGFSDHRAEFKYGARIYLSAQYEQLKQQFSAQYKARPGRVLFYR